MSEGATDDVDLMGSVNAFAHIAYSDLMTIVLVSILFALASLPVITIGAAILAAVETMTAVVMGEGRGGPTTERERLRLFVESFRTHLRAGVPYSVILIAVVTTMGIYGFTATIQQSGLLFIGALLGLYAVVIGVTWLFRAASIAVRAPDPIRFTDAVQNGGYIALEHPWYAAMHLITVGVILLVSVVALPAYVLVVPGPVVSSIWSRQYPLPSRWLRLATTP